jgi:CheY-like chemotaxis protein
MTGTELLVRAQAAIPEIPVMLMSGYSAQDLRARGLLLGMESRARADSSPLRKRFSP